MPCRVIPCRLLRQMSMAIAILLFLFGTHPASAGIINATALESRLYHTIGAYNTSFDQSQINNEPLDGKIIGTLVNGPHYIPSKGDPQFGMTVEGTAVGITKWEPLLGYLGINYSGSLNVNGPGTAPSEDMATFSVRAIASGQALKLVEPKEKAFGIYRYQLIGTVDPGFELRVVANGAVGNQLSSSNFFRSNDDKTFTGSFNYQFNSGAIENTDLFPWGSTPLWLEESIQISIIRKDRSVTSGGGRFQVVGDPVSVEIVSSVPEPSSAVSASVIAVALCLYRRRSKR
jgi:hypothetical protein